VLWTAQQTLIPAFQLHLRHAVLQGLATVGKCTCGGPDSLITCGDVALCSATDAPLARRRA
jgi:hypothetical protein